MPGSSSAEPDRIRLQKVLAAAGVGSRRACEQLIAEGRVTVDGRVITEQGVRVDPATAVIEVDGERIAVRPGTEVWLLNKPLGMHSTMSDPQGRPCVGDLVSGRSTRLFHVGRLDADTEGLLLLTNDGDLAHLLSHPSHEVEKEYLATVKGQLVGKVARELESGVELEDGPAVADRVRVVDSLPGATLVEITLHSGRNRVVRRMFEHVGHPVTALVRTRLGSLRIGQLRPGSMRQLSAAEVGALEASAGARD